MHAAGAFALPSPSPVWLTVQTTAEADVSEHFQSASLPRVSQPALSGHEYSCHLFFSESTWDFLSALYLSTAYHVFLISVEHLDSEDFLVCHRLPSLLHLLGAFRHTRGKGQVVREFCVWQRPVLPWCSLQVESGGMRCREHEAPAASLPDCSSQDSLPWSTEGVAQCSGFLESRPLARGLQGIPVSFWFYFQFRLGAVLSVAHLDTCACFACLHRTGRLPCLRNRRHPLKRIGPA